MTAANVEIVATGLADDWWYWTLSAALFAAAIALSGRYRALTARVRRTAVRRGLVELPPGHALETAPRGPWSDPSWLALAAGVWVVAAPWTWGYQGEDGAIAADVVTGGAVIALALAAIVLPALWALNLLAGLWLVVAPWIVGYGNANGPVGLSDTIAGVVVSAVAIACLAAAERAVRTGQARAIGRIRPRR